ncbi:MAG: acyl carrier protein [Planctomycetes bacterium]|nr:acyl carrier protein [Planctomycetota bacterium]
MLALRSEIIRKVAELGELEEKDVAEDQPLKDLGIDSLMTIELVVFIERMIQRQFPEERMGAIRTCRDIFREVETLIQPAS